MTCAGYNWAIPEDIHTIPQTAFWNSEGKGGRGGGGGVFELKIRRQGVTYDWNLEQVYSLKTLIFKQLLLDEVFVISGIIKVEVSVISLSLRLRLITLNFLLGR